MTSRGLRTAFAWMTPALLAAALTAQAQAPRPGIDRPIRVAMYRGDGGGDSWHTNIHTSHTVMASMLADPAAAGLGDSLVIPTAGFIFRTMPTRPGTGGPDGTCGGGACGPDAPTIASFVSYMRDSADVMILSSVSNFGSRVTDPGQRQILADFWTTKGYVGIHGIADSKGTWSPLDTIHGTQFNNHPNEQVARLRIDSVFSTDSSWRYLNRGMFSNGTDSSFLEEWFFYTNSGAQIRARPFLKPTTKLVETGMQNIGSTAMGDHPLSWYRQLPTGGRVFYTGMGHRAQVWQVTRAFRRQIYNAILWSAKYDSLSKVVAINPGRKAPGAATQYSRLAAGPGMLTVTTLQPGTHKVELFGVDGRRVAMQEGSGAERAYNFTGLRPGVYVVAVATPGGRSRRLVTVP